MFLAGLSLKICLDVKLLNVIPLNIFGNDLPCALKRVISGLPYLPESSAKKENVYLLVVAFMHMEVSRVVKNFPFFSYKAEVSDRMRLEFCD